MRVNPFELERWQSIWENKVAVNISESGVEPLTTRELLGDSAAADALLSLRLGYPQTNGTEEVRALIAAQYPAAKAENVLLTAGCAEANFLVAWSLLEPADELLMMVPNYLQVWGLGDAFGAQVKPLLLREKLSWAPDLNELDRLITPKTKLIAICNPNNPTGAVLSDLAMKAICNAAAKVGAYILADEVYRGAELSGQATPTFWGRYDRLFCTGGLSKAFGLPGLRTGWIISSPQSTEKLWAYHDYASMAPTMLTDRLASMALEPSRREKILSRTRKILNAHYPIVRDWAVKHSSLLTHIPPAAGAIAWFGYSEPWKSAEMAEDLRVRKRLLIVPGNQLGMDGYFRIGYGGEEAPLRKGLDLMDEWFAEQASSQASSKSTLQAAR
jgi:aspartate/methionine/tyrosine aminotransferase